MKVLTTSSSFGKVNPEPLEKLISAGLTVEQNPYGRKLTIEESKNLYPGVDLLIAGTEKINYENLSHANRLKFICRLGVGMDNVDRKAAESRNIELDNTPSAHVDGVAELTLAGMLDMCRHISRLDRNIRKGIWNKHMGFLLKGKTIGIVGLGQVGKRLVELLKPFSVQILAYDLYPDKEFAERNNIKWCDLNELFTISDLISLHVPGIKENYHMISYDLLEQAKDHLMLINIARGGIVNEDALFEFLNKHRDASAYVDTFEQEPYSGPLLELENCLLTPHIGSYAREVRVNMEMEAAEKIIDKYNRIKNG
jgi:D-3-phosphoglycerate dehydrogenase